MTWKLADADVPGATVPSVAAPAGNDRPAGRRVQATAASRSGALPGLRSVALTVNVPGVDQRGRADRGQGRAAARSAARTRPGSSRGWRPVWTGTPPPGRPAPPGSPGRGRRWWRPGPRPRWPACCAPWSFEDPGRDVELVLRAHVVDVPADQPAVDVDERPVVGGCPRPARCRRSARRPARSCCRGRFELEAVRYQPMPGGTPRPTTSRAASPAASRGPGSRAGPSRGRCRTGRWRSCGPRTGSCSLLPPGAPISRQVTGADGAARAWRCTGPASSRRTGRRVAGVLDPARRRRCPGRRGAPRRGT